MTTISGRNWSTKIAIVHFHEVLVISLLFSNF
jgi:hypothetical protein